MIDNKKSLQDISLGRMFDVAIVEPSEATELGSFLINDAASVLK